jgi:hypothetical protein
MEVARFFAQNPGFATQHIMARAGQATENPSWILSWSKGSVLSLVQTWSV